jgi:hypothetical protein
MHEPEPSEASLRSAKSADVGEHQPSRVADDDVVDLTRAVDERADLPPRLMRRLGERCRELGRRELRQRDAAPVDALVRLDRGR